MKHRFITTKNSFETRGFPPQEDLHQSSHSLLLGHKATLYSQNNRERHPSTFSQQEEFYKKESKF